MAEALSNNPNIITRTTHRVNSVSARSTGPRFLIADDHAMFAETLRVYLEKTYTVVGVVLDGFSMVAEAMRLRPDVIVVDVGMPLLNGLDAAWRIREQAPRIKFVFLTMRDDPNLAAAALKLGPIAFVLKHSAGQELFKAIGQVLKGEPYLTPKVRAEDWVATNARARQFSKEMTPRQKEIVQLLGEGRAVKEIAGHLDVSEKTAQHARRTAPIAEAPSKSLIAPKENSREGHCYRRGRQRSNWLSVYSTNQEHARDG